MTRRPRLSSHRHPHIRVVVFMRLEHNTISIISTQQNIYDIYTTYYLHSKISIISTQLNIYNIYTTEHNSGIMLVDEYIESVCIMLLYRRLRTESSVRASISIPTLEP